LHLGLTLKAEHKKGRKKIAKDNPAKNLGLKSCKNWLGFLGKNYRIGFYRKL